MLYINISRTTLNHSESDGLSLSLSLNRRTHTHSHATPGVPSMHDTHTTLSETFAHNRRTDGRDEPHAARHSTLYSFLTCTLCIVPQAAPHAKSDSVPISPPHRRWCALRTHSSHRSTAQDPLSHRTQISTSPRGGRAQNSSSPHTNPSGANRRAR